MPNPYGDAFNVLLQGAMSADGLLGHLRGTWARSRTTTTGVDPGTGDPIVTTATANVLGYFAWLSNIEAQDFKGDVNAVLITDPGQLQAGDTVAGSLGRFLVLEEGPQLRGPYERVPLKRSA